MAIMTMTILAIAILATVIMMEKALVEKWAKGSMFGNTMIQLLVDNGSRELSLSVRARCHFIIGVLRAQHPVILNDQSPDPRDLLADLIMVVSRLCHARDATLVSSPEQVFSRGTGM